MYNEKRFKITIFFTRIRRYLFIFFFVILSLVGAYVVSEVLTEIVRLDQKIATVLMVATGVTVFCIWEASPNSHLYVLLLSYINE